MHTALKTVAVFALAATVHAEYVLHVLGNAQDAGLPQAGASHPNDQRAWANPALERYATSLAVVDTATDRAWIFDATPNIKAQLHHLGLNDRGVAGIFLTHGHIGHYTGLMHFGREAMGARDVATFVMPRMHSFLQTNGPWSLLVKLGNIRLSPLVAQEPVELNADLWVTPVLVPHRGEFTETVAFRIRGPRRSVMYLPDIDRWEQWDQDLAAVVASHDLLFLDGSFFDAGELPGRDMSKIPHPTVVDTMARLAALPRADRAKVHFVHMNHTNPLIFADSAARKRVAAEGFNVADQFDTHRL